MERTNRGDRYGEFCEATGISPFPGSTDICYYNFANPNMGLISYVLIHTWGVV